MTDQPGENYAWLPPTRTISGRVTNLYSGAGVDGVAVAFSGGAGTAATAGGGFYSLDVPVDWSGRATPGLEQAGVFTAAWREYGAAATNQANQDYGWTPAAPVVSGRVMNTRTNLGVDGVAVTFSGGGGVATTTNGGYYARTLPWDWSGTATPALAPGGTGSPATRDYSHLQPGQTGQNYGWTPPDRTISGRVTG